MEEKVVSVSNISCGHCVRTIERELRELAGVVRAEASAETKRLRVSWNSPANWQQIENLLREINYPVQTE